MEKNEKIFNIAIEDRKFKIIISSVSNTLTITAEEEGSNVFPTSFERVDTIESLYKANIRFQGFRSTDEIEKIFVKNFEENKMNFSLKNNALVLSFVLNDENIDISLKRKEDIDKVKAALLNVNERASKFKKAVFSLGSKVNQIKDLESNIKIQKLQEEIRELKNNTASQIDSLRNDINNFIPQIRTIIDEQTNKNSQDKTETINALKTDIDTQKTVILNEIQNLFKAQTKLIEEKQTLFSTQVQQLIQEQICHSSIPVHPLKSISEIKHVTTLANNSSITYNCLCFLKDKRLAASGGREIRIFNLTNNHCDFVIENAHNEIIYPICILENGNLVSAAKDGTIKVWEIRGNTFRCLKTLEGHTKIIYRVISLSENRIGSCSEDGTIKIWNSESYECLKTLTDHTSIYVDALIELKNKKHFISGVECVRVWDSTNYLSQKVEIANQCYNLLEIDDGRVICARWVELDIINVEKLLVEKTIPNFGLTGAYSFCLLKSGNLLCGDWCGYFHEIDIKNYQLVFQKKIFSSCAYCLIKDEFERVICASYDGKVTIFN